MVTLDSGFEDAAREALLADAERTLRDDVGPLLEATARANFEAYAARNGYDIGHIWADADGPFVDRAGDAVHLRIEWPGLTALFEFGVSPHTIDGNPLLHFYWEDIGQWIRTESVEWGSETGGIPESRAIRDAMHTLRGVLQS